MLRSGLILLFLLTISSAASASDWHYFGDAGGKQETSMFYDSNTLQRPTPKTVRVWVEGLPERELLRYNASGRIGNEAAHKIAAGYVPGYLLLPSISDQFPIHGVTLLGARVEFTLWEILADNGDVQPVVREYWELDCRGERVDLLSFTKFSPKGAIKATHVFSVPSYGYIPPDTTAQWLSEMVCSKR